MLVVGDMYDVDVDSYLRRGFGKSKKKKKKKEETTKATSSEGSESEYKTGEQFGQPLFDGQ